MQMIDYMRYNKTHFGPVSLRSSFLPSFQFSSIMLRQVSPYSSSHPLALRSLCFNLPDN